MRKIVLEAWCAEVNSAMAAHLPNFQPMGRKRPGEWPRMQKFAWMHPGGIEWDVAFRPLDEEFDVFAGWSTRTRSGFANILQVASPEILDACSADAMMLPTAVIALRSGAAYWSFWSPSPDAVDDPDVFASAFAKQHATELTLEDAIRLVRPTVAAAIREIEESCIPYLEQVTRFKAAKARECD